MRGGIILVIVIALPTACICIASGLVRARPRVGPDVLRATFLEAGPRVGPDVLRATLLEATRVLGAANVSFAPTKGTLLQLVRDGTFLRADDDVDLLVPHEDYEKAKEALRGGFNGDAEVTWDEISKGIFFQLHYSSPKGTWAWLDIYADTGDENTVCVAWEEQAYARPEMETTQYLLNGRAVEQRVPKDPEHLVTLLYGQTWKTPLPKGAYSTVDSEGTFFNQNCKRVGVSAKDLHTNAKSNNAAAQPSYGNSLASVSSSGLIGSHHPTYANVDLENTSPKKPKLWLFWDSSTEGGGAALDSMPGASEATRLSSETVHAHCGLDFEVQLVGKTSIHKHLERFKLPLYFEKLPPHIQGDLGSIALLAEHGGVYLDLDVIMFRSLLPLWEEATSPRGPELTSMTLSHLKQPSFVHGFMMARPESPLLEKMFFEFMAFIKDRGNCTEAKCATYSKFGWSDMIYGRGWAVLADYVSQHGLNSYKVAGVDLEYTPHPYASGAVDLFLTQPTHRYAPPPDGAYLAHWMHSLVKGKVPGFEVLTQGDLLDGTRLFSRLVLRALNRTVPQSVAAGAGGNASDGVSGVLARSSGTRSEMRSGHVTLEGKVTILQSVSGDGGGNASDGVSDDLDRSSGRRSGTRSGHVTPDEKVTVLKSVPGGGSGMRSSHVTPDGKVTVLQSVPGGGEEKVGTDGSVDAVQRTR